MLQGIGNEIAFMAVLVVSAWLSSALAYRMVGGATLIPLPDSDNPYLTGLTKAVTIGFLGLIVFFFVRAFTSQVDLTVLIIRMGGVGIAIVIKIYYIWQVRRLRRQRAMLLKHRASGGGIGSFTL